MEHFVIIFQFIIYAIIAEYIKLIISIIFAIVVPVYCSIVISRYRDFWILKQKVYKYLYSLNDLKIRYDKLKIIHDKILEVKLDLEVLNHKFSEQPIEKFLLKINSYLNSKYLNTVRIKWVDHESEPFIDTQQIILIEKEFLENSLKTVKKLKPNYWVIIKPY